MVTRETSISDGLTQLGLPSSDQAVRRLVRLAELLENDAVELGFLGPNEGRRVVPRHLMESVALLDVLPDEGTIVDVGSGAGLPGLALACMGRRLVLIDSLARRTSFLKRVSDELELDADVRTSRAEDAARGDLRDTAAASVARALAAPPVALELCLPFVRPGGRLAILTSAPDPGAERAPEPERNDRTESTGRVAVPIGDASPPAERSAEPRLGRTTDDSVDERLSAVARQLGAGLVTWRALAVPGVDEPRWVMMVDKRDPTPDRFPRRPGVPKRRPLGGDVASVH